jgi:4-hydroxythreonine-4-phosphate dehydrogenase
MTARRAASVPAAAPIGVTLGDPCGIGAEVTLRALPLLPDAVRADVRLYGHAPYLEAARALLAPRAHAGALDMRPLLVVASPAEAVPPSHLGVVEVHPGGPLPAAAPGRPHVAAARLQHDALLRATDDALARRLRAVVTAPWTKHILALAGLPPTGHTEVLGLRAGVAHPTMLLAGDALRVALVTAHVPLSQVAAHVTPAAIEATLRAVITQAAPLYGVGAPRVAVCGLNPHAGEHGVLGQEEDAVIGPAVEAARRAFPDAHIWGPAPADTLFARVVHGRAADFVVAMYHDQGLAPLKLWHHQQAANVTLGLPFLRTSPDHGSAYDIAGLGRASPDSMRYALALADRLSAHGR